MDGYLGKREQFQKKGVGDAEEKINVGGSVVAVAEGPQFACGSAVRS
jgi:predicted RNA-binding protein